jgi:hypothetical protein
MMAVMFDCNGSGRRYAGGAAFFFLNEAKDLAFSFIKKF